jgi:hypothetical protein
MATPTIIINTTFSAKNIASAAAVYLWTVPATGTYRIQVRLSGVAGNGDYIAYLTLNAGGVLAAEPMLPKTTMAAASGETAFWFSTIVVDAIVNDVVSAMVDGLAADTNVAGNVRIFADSSLDAVAMPVNGSGLTALGDARLANLDALISSRLAASGYTAPPTASQIDSQLSGAHGAGSWGAAGLGSSTYTDTVLDPSSNPIEGVQVEAYSDSDRETLVDVQLTDVNGYFTMHLNPGTYYCRAAKAGYSFTDWEKVIA